MSRWRLLPRGHPAARPGGFLAALARFLPTGTALLPLLLAPSLRATDRAVADRLIVERPTLRSLGFEWRIQGDANGNATAAVHYRREGAGAWRTYLPLFRLGRGLRVQNSMIGRGAFYTIPDALAGSIMDLAPGTTYEVRLTLQDPDGVDGEAERTLTLRTRPEPRVPAAAEIRHVYPPGFTGEKEKPFFENLMHAVNGYPPITDTYQTLHPNAAKPGTVIKVHAGVHTYDNTLYWKDGRPQFSYWLHGTITLVANGTVEQPIFIVAAGDGEAIFDGAGCHNLFNVRSADHLHFEGLTIRNTAIAFFGGFQGERGGGVKGLTVRDCWIEGVVYGILAQDGRSEDFTFTDNVILGRNPPDRLGAFGRTQAGYAVNIAGQGHTVAHNYVAHFWDGINVFTSSLADPAYGQQSRAIDFHDNDLHNCVDQFIEADGGYANIRILRNRGFNCPSQPLSTQPVHAGPVYWIRNVIWNAAGGKMTMKNNNGAQVFVFLHNTSATHLKMPPNIGQKPEQGTWLIQNNLSIGPRTPGGDRVTFVERQWNPQTGRADLPVPPSVVVELCDGVAGPSHIVDHNAYTAGISGDVWLVGGKRFPSLDALRAATCYERNSLLVDGYSVFAGAAEPPHALRGSGFVLPRDVDLRLAPGSPPVDAGAVIPGVNDDFTGRAPDIGAYEFGQPLPQYGPRGARLRERLRAMLGVGPERQAPERPSAP